MMMHTFRYVFTKYRDILNVNFAYNEVNREIHMYTLAEIALPPVPIYKIILMYWYS